MTFYEAIQHLKDGKNISIIGYHDIYYLELSVKHNNTNFNSFIGYTNFVNVIGKYIITKDAISIVDIPKEYINKVISSNIFEWKSITHNNLGITYDIKKIYYNGGSEPYRPYPKDMSSKDWAIVNTKDIITNKDISLMSNIIASNNIKEQVNNKINNIKMSQSKSYIGVFMITAIAATLGEAMLEGVVEGDTLHMEIDDLSRDGYILNNNGNKGWMAKEPFEATYFPLAEPSRISPQDVDLFIVKGKGQKLGEKTCVVLDSTITGFDTLGHSAVVDPNNYKQEIGETIARNKITNDIWGHLGFVLQWAKNGLKYPNTNKE